MDTLSDMIQKTVLVLGAVFILLAMPFFLMRVADVCGSEEGLWQQCPHSGFRPDCQSPATNSHQGK